jgi:hypothetical protein
VTNGATPEQQVAWLQNELQDAHLVIGQQQMQMLKQQQQLQAMQQRMMELEAQGEAKTEPQEEVQTGKPKAKVK